MQKDVTPHRHRKKKVQREMSVEENDEENSMGNDESLENDCDKKR